MNPDEITAKLARLDELELRFDAAVQHAKLEAMKELAYGAGHEINNPLANIATRAQTLLRDETNPERRRKLAAINAQAFRAHEMIADLMLFARPPQMRPEATDLNSLVRTVADQWRKNADGSDLNIVDDPAPESIIANIDPVQLRVALDALVKNAMEAGDENIEIRLRVRRTDESSRNGSPTVASHAEITVADNGPGIPPEIRDKIFDPFFSGREAGRGLGFGLSKCWRIVTLHGGEIEVRDTPGGGATFVVALPFSQDPSLSGTR